MIFHGVNIPDNVIDEYVDKLGCSIEEACDAWLCDNGKATSAEADAMTKKAQFAGVGKIVDADYKKSERKPKERKVNVEKRYIIKHLYDVLYTFADNLEMRNDEKYIDFEYEDKSYTINLVEHRTKKPQHLVID